ncbi:polyhydroxyalkanoate synthesis repressor PhaR [Aliikangiella coralliicola]|uniref:Polyhydroxyalkanoate synthesis repressor PhaR n=1 Tax=Aliikangiella coralliicola TaxID=2592383 RepID=A0A545UEG9_9GAMM|nr:polyhydroxyalkanoate synthesis repressor PhaR [Aliikangiella coralliicola]TQV87870.1 polyhydroxyalkanoate synthesis repressor PhaR [Aliikangiella coralliicola]
MSEMRVIKKYPNRRLYDTQISSYITLNDIKDLVMSYTDFKVVDAKTNEDLTRCTLMQIIAEEETNGHPIMTSEILKEFVRFYGDSMQAMMSRFLEHSIKLFMERRAGLKSPLNTILGANPVSLMQNIAEQNMDSWKAKSTTVEEKESSTTQASHY